MKESVDSVMQYTEMIIEICHNTSMRESALLYLIGVVSRQLEEVTTIEEVRFWNHFLLQRTIEIERD